MIRNHKYKSALILTLFLLLISLKTEKLEDIKHIYYLEGIRIDAVINVKGGIYLKRGQSAGFHYDLLNKFANYERSKIYIRPTHGEDYWRELLDGKIDLLVINSNEIIPEEYQENLISSISLNSKDDVIVLTKSNLRLLRHLNHWLGFYKESLDFKKLENFYNKRIAFVTSTPERLIGSLSPFDKIIKRYAQEIDWDWRLLAALIYRESKFNAEAKSHRDAVGLMQIRESVAKKYGVKNIYDPEENIRAGTFLLKSLLRTYNSPTLDSVNRIKFVLAAYNAGEGRIIDCINYAKYKGVDYTNWEQVASVLPQMKIDPGPDNLLKYGPFKGIETITHVDYIISRYEEYKYLVK